MFNFDFYILITKNWLLSNRLCLNETMTVNMLFSLRCLTPENLSNFQNSTKLLGLIINAKLSWNLFYVSIWYVTQA